MNDSPVRSGTWLSEDILLIALSGPEQPDRVTDLESRAHAYGEGEALLTVRFADPPPPGEPSGLVDEVCDVRAFARMILGALPSRARPGVGDFLAHTSTEHATTDPLRLHQSLFLLREAVRERLPHSVTSHDEPAGLGLDEVLAVDERAFFLNGWFHDEGRATRMTAVAPEGLRAELLGRTFRYPRADVEQFYADGGEAPEKPGFAAYVELDGPSLHPSGWTLELLTSGQTGIEARGPRTIRDPVEVRNKILAALAHEPPSEERFLVEHVLPAITRIQARTSRDGEVERVVELGTRSGAPAASIVIPLYRRIDFLEHQLAQFALDPEVRGADLVFLLDSPALAEKTESFARTLHELYRVPFRLALLRSHAGYAGVNNAGASLAEGRLLVLLNSDVFPDRPGWLGTMASFYDATPGIGALGAKLLYEDDSLQHAGMTFLRDTASGLWGNAHHFKGLHRRLEAANVARAVPAVTGACLMIDRELYGRLGGLRGRFVGGDNEDSDLCLRLIEEGFQNWYLPDAELYHLEGQSLPEGLRKLTRRYNDWLQTRDWGALIESVAPGEAVLAAANVRDE